MSREKNGHSILNTRNLKDSFPNISTDRREHKKYVSVGWEIKGRWWWRGRYGWNDWILGVKRSWEGILDHVPKWEMIVTLRCKKRGGLYPVSSLEPLDEQPDTFAGQWCGNIKWSQGTWFVCSQASLVLLCSSLAQPSVPSHRCGLQTQRSLAGT